jgi:endonuclease/exonuclease/phosphatase family metal-dependent hydrolase
VQLSLKRVALIAAKKGAQTMTRRYPALLVIAAALFLGAVAEADQELTIATFNCEFLTRPKVHVKFGESFDLSPARQEIWNQAGYRDQKFAEAARAVAKVIVEINADVIGLEEVGNETDVKELLEEVRRLGLDYRYYVVGSPVEERTYQNNAVFSRFELKDLVSPIPGREAYDTELDDPETEEWTAVRKGLRVSFSAFGQTFHLYVLHLTSERGGYEADAQRIAEASIVRRHYLPLLTSGANLIVMGDLNDRRNDPAIRRIRGRDDIQPDLIQTGRYYYFDRTELDTRWTYNFRGTREQIDHILLSESIEQRCRRIRARTLNHGNQLVSDHLPFIVRLNLKE